MTVSFLSNLNIGVIGLGYVGLPITIAFARKFKTIGFDIDPRRVEALRNGKDWTGEISEAELKASSVAFTSDIASLEDADFFVVAVPTPVTTANDPDFSMLRGACAIIGQVIKPGAIVAFESTVYPGATEEICGPALEAASGLRCGVDFKLAYSPERINPGDTLHKLENIVKIVSAQDEESLETVTNVYSSIIDAGVHKASSIKVAEAAKVLENTQRDINIALMNEISKICSLVGIRTGEVLKAAGTKWNFLPFTPGLVGGHCVGVDPYYLTAKAKELGYHPEVILSGRRINDSMPSYLADMIVKNLAVSGIAVHTARIGLLGITFKEAVPDIRNSKVASLYEALAAYGIKPRVCDPYADVQQTLNEFGIVLEDSADWTQLDVAILAVPHPEFLVGIEEKLRKSVREGGIVVDIRSVLDPAALGDDIKYLSL